MIRNTTADMHADYEGDEFYRTTANDIGSGTQVSKRCKSPVILIFVLFIRNDLAW